MGNEKGREGMRGAGGGSGRCTDGCVTDASVRLAWGAVQFRKRSCLDGTRVVGVNGTEWLDVTPAILL